MPRFAQISHPHWIEAPLSVVQAHFADLEHHIDNAVHPALHLELLSRDASGARFVREVRRLGVRQRDVFERRIMLDGSIVDRTVAGFNKGGSLCFHFEPETVADRPGTRVEVTVRLPLPPFIGLLVKPLLQARVRRELRLAASEDRHDIVERGYPRWRVTETLTD